MTITSVGRSRLEWISQILRFNEGWLLRFYGLVPEGHLHLRSGVRHIAEMRKQSKWRCYSPFVKQCRARSIKSPGRQWLQMPTFGDLNCDVAFFCVTGLVEILKVGY